MRVLVLTTDAYGGHGGIAFYNRCLCDALADIPEVEEVVVLSRATRFDPTNVPAKVRLVLEALGGKARYLLAAVKMLRESFDFVICGHINLLRLAVPLAMFKRVPLVLQVHGIDVWKPSRFFDKWLLSRVDAVWSVSKVTRDRMIAWSGLPESKFLIMPNTYHADCFGIGEKRPDLIERYGLHGRKVMMTLARLAGYERYKGIDETLEVLPSLLEVYPNLSYLIVGDGDDHARLRKKADALGLEKVVVFAGLVEERDKADHYRLADVFVLPGRGEGFGIVFLEAMACGVPVVGSLIDGSREALRDGTLGELVDPADKDSIHNGILKALSKPIAIPAGLDYFDWPHFRGRIRDALGKLGLVAHIGNRA